MPIHWYKKFYGQTEYDEIQSIITEEMKESKQLKILLNIIQIKDNIGLVQYPSIKKLFIQYTRIV